jgi:hypothetical protein
VEEIVAGNARDSKVGRKEEGSRKLRLISVIWSGLMWRLRSDCFHRIRLQKFAPGTWHSYLSMCILRLNSFLPAKAQRGMEYV